jgi:predicted DNA binding CopG/RHH family protein
MKAKHKKENEILEYDSQDTTAFIDTRRTKKLDDLGIRLPAEKLTTQISIRLPTRMLNAIRAYSSEHDLPYQAVIKLFLQSEIKRHRIAS